jgi:hypothetical protein
MSARTSFWKQRLKVWSLGVDIEPVIPFLGRNGDRGGCTFRPLLAVSLTVLALASPFSAAVAWGALAKNSVGTAQIKNGAVTSAKIKAANVGMTQINHTVWNTAIASGVLASRPAAAAGNLSYLYFATDVAGGTLFRSNGSAWIKVAASVNEPLVADSVDSSIIANGSITAADILAGEIGTPNLPTEP